MSAMSIASQRKCLENYFSLVRNFFGDYIDQIAVVIAIWIGLAILESIKTLYFAYNKWLYLLYLAHSLYIYLPWIGFSLIIGVITQQTQSWRRNDASIFYLHVPWALGFAALHLFVVASSYQIYVPGFAEQSIWSIYGQHAIGWFNYELLAYLAVALLWHRGFCQDNSLESGNSEFLTHKKEEVDSSDADKLVMFNSTEGLVTAELSQIEWLLADNNYTLVQLPERQVRVRSGFRELLKLLQAMSAEEVFIQTHRSAAVNFSHVALVAKTRITTRSGTRIPVSRRRFKELTNRNLVI